MLTEADIIKWCWGSDYTHNIGTVFCYQRDRYRMTKESYKNND